MGWFRDSPELEEMRLRSLGTAECLPIMLHNGQVSRGSNMY
jgi:hypothetical protein